MTKKRQIASILLICAMICAVLLGSILLVSASSPTDYKKSDVLVVSSGVKNVTTEEQFLKQHHVNHPEIEKVGSYIIPKSETGLGVYSDGSTMNFSYRAPIDFSEKTATDQLIEIYPLFGENYAKIKDIKIILTDADDPSNTVGIHFDDTYDGGTIYARVLYAGKDISYGTRLDSGKYGIYLNNCAYSAAKPFASKTGLVSPFSMQLDYAKKVVHSSYYSDWGIFTTKQILNLSDSLQVGAGLAWEGFKNDKAYISVSVSFTDNVTELKPGGVIIKSINGVNMDGEFANDLSNMPSPSIVPSTEKTYGETLPDGAVGVEYSIPSVVASDWFFGITSDSNISYVVEKKTGNEFKGTEFVGVNGGYFIPDSEGEYRVKYSATNGVKKSEIDIGFEIKEALPSLMISQVGQYSTPKLNEYFYIPETVVSGGSGLLTKKETLFYDGQEVSLSETREILIDKSGVVSLMVEASGYCESTVKFFSVEVKDGTVLKVQDMPKIIKGNNAETLYLPEAVAYKTTDNSKVDVTITVDGVVLGEDRAITTNKKSGECLNVVYKAGDAVKRYEVFVVEDNTFKQVPVDFVVKNGQVDVASDVSGILVETAQDGAGVTWGYPVVTGYGSSKMQFVLSQTTSDKLNFEYIDLILSDAKENQKDFFIRIFKDGSKEYSIKETSIQVNGVGDTITYQGSINNVGGSFMFYIDGNALYNNSGNLIYDFSNEYNAELSYMTLKFGKVTGSSSIRLDMLSNQTLGCDPVYGWADAGVVLSFAKKLPIVSYVSINSEFIIPACSAYDLTSSGGSVTLTVKEPDGITRLLNNVDCSADISFVPNKLGLYILEYNTTDGNGNTSRISFNLSVLDQINPVLTIDGKLKDEIKLGQKVVLPTATATDDIDGDCKVLIFVRELSTYRLLLVENGEYTFENEGDYEIIYQTHDSAYNYTQYIFKVTVKRG